MKQIIQWGLILTGLIGPAHAAEPEKPLAAMKPTVILVLTEKSYDPERPSSARLKCLIRNSGNDALDVPIGYDGNAVMLHSGVMTLVRGFPKGGGRDAAAKPEMKRLRLQPGEAAIIFDLSVDAILLKGSKSRDVWRWDWPRRSAPPPSPLHPRAGLVEQVMLQAEILVGKQRLVSDFVVLKVKSKPMPPAPNNSAGEEAHVEAERP